MGKEEDPFGETRMTLGEHLDELRSRLVKGVGTVFVAMILAWIFHNEIDTIMQRPFVRAMNMLQADLVEQALEIIEREGVPRTTFFVTEDPSDLRLRNWDTRPRWFGMGERIIYLLKICLYFSLFLGGPILLWQLWQFIAAGLYKKERRAILGYFPISVAMFLVGVLFGYFFMVPYAAYFLNKGPIELGLPTLTIQSYLTFLTSLSLAFGVIFQLPLIMSFLGGSGIVPPAAMSKYRGHFIVSAFVIAAILTPPDPITQLMMGIPLVVLYEVGILAARLAARQRRDTRLPPEEES